MKNIFKIESITFDPETGNPLEIKGVEISNDANVQEISASGAFVNTLVETIGNIAERFDKNSTPVVKDIKEIEVKPVKVESKKLETTDFREIKHEFPTATFHGGEPIKKFSITKAWRAIPVPEELKPEGTDKYRWEDSKGLLGDAVTVNGQTYGAVYIHIYGMKQKCFISIRADNVKFEDDIRPEEFEDFLDTINIPDEIKDYIKKVIEL